MTEVQYVGIGRVLENMMDHPLLRDLTLEQVIRYTVRFIGLHGYPKLYKDKEEIIGIKDYRGLLPCDLISITQVKDLKTKVCLRSMTDTFEPGHDHRHCRQGLTFKTQGRVLFTSFEKGAVVVAYKAIPVDEDGFPLLIDNETYLNALEAFIKMKVFTTKYETGDIQAGVLENAKKDYAWAAHLVKQEFTMPSISEMESISRMLTTTIKSVKQFDSGFRHLGDREYIRRH